jgi:uncharacterized membrane protein
MTQNMEPSIFLGDHVSNLTVPVPVWICYSGALQFGHASAVAPSKNWSVIAINLAALFLCESITVGSFGRRCLNPFWRSHSA